MKIFMKEHRFLLILVALIIGALWLVLYQNLAHEYTMQGQTVSILDHISGVSGYEVREDGDGYAFTAQDADPQFFLKGIAAAGGIELSFDRANMGSKELPIQVFYAKANEGYSERRSSKTILGAGKASCILPIPLAEYETLRVDINGDFYLADIKICKEEVLSKTYISSKTLDVCKWYFPTIIIGFSLIFWAHSSGLKNSGLSGKRYLKSLLIGQEGGKREVYLDYLRVFAAILVVVVHSCSPIADLPIGDWRKLLMTFLVTFAMSCNLLYVMLSDTLLLSSKKGTSVGAFYLRRVSKVLIPLALYYFLYLKSNEKVSLLPPRHIGTGFLTILQGPSEIAPHFGIIYVIVGLYIAAPFLKVMVQHLDSRKLRYLGIMIFVFTIIRAYLPLLGINPGISTFLSGWEGVFLLGYILTRLDLETQDKKRQDILFYLCMAAAFVSYLVMTFTVYYHYDWRDLVYNNVPTMVIFSVGIYLLFLRSKNWLNDRPSFLLSLLSKYSYSIILVHWYILPFVNGKLHVTTLRFGCIGGIAATVFLVFVISALVSIVFDNTVVIVFLTLFSKLTRPMKKATDDIPLFS